MRKNMTKFLAKISKVAPWTEWLWLKKIKNFFKKKVKSQRDWMNTIFKVIQVITGKSKHFCFLCRTWWKNIQQCEVPHIGQKLSSDPVACESNRLFYFYLLGCNNATRKCTGWPKGHVHVWTLWNTGMGFGLNTASLMIQWSNLDRKKTKQSNRNQLIDM